MFENLETYLNSTQVVLVMNNDDISYLLEESAKRNQLIKAKVINVQKLTPQISDRYYLFMKEYFNINPSFAKKLIPIFEYLSPSMAFQSEKIVKVYEIYTSLIEAKMITFFPVSVLNNKEVILYNLEEVPPILKQHQIAYQQLNPNISKKNTIEVHVTKDYQEYLLSIMLHLIEKINLFTKLDDIHLVNVNQQDALQLRKWLKELRIPFVYHQSQMITSYPSIIKFINSLKSKGFQEAYDWIIKHAKTEEDYLLLDQVIHCLNHFTEEERNNHIDLLLFELSEIKIQPTLLKNAIHLWPKSHISVVENAHLFVLNFNLLNYPSSAIDDDYLLDIEKEQIQMPSSVEMNENSKAILQHFLIDHEHLEVFHYQYDQDQKQEFPDLNLNYTILPFDLDKHTFSYFNIMLKHYQYSQNPFINQDAYKSQFTGLQKETIDALIAKRVSVSQTSLNMFLECPFRYFLAYLLKFNSMDKSFALYYGNVTHKYVEDFYLKEPIHFKTFFDQFTKNIPSDEEFKYGLYIPLLEKRLEELGKILPSVSLRDEFTTYGSEESISFLSDIDSRFLLLGKIDQLYLYKNTDKNHVVIIDYKTGNTSFDYQNTIDLKQIQLLMYYYLFMHKYNPEEVQIVGMYYQQLHIPRLNRGDSDNTILKAFAYDGISVEIVDTLKKMSDQVSIKGIKFSKEGLLSKSNRIFTKEEMEDLYVRLDTLIADVIYKIKKGEFDISPLPIPKGAQTSKSCEYCNFKNICYLANSVKSSVLFTEEGGEEDE